VLLIHTGGDVAENILHNFELNDVHPAPEHIAHTWGTGWGKAVDECMRNHSTDSPAEIEDLRQSLSSFKYIIASDILIYVSAYPALVDSLEELFMCYGAVEFIMSWQRRIADSKTFFEMMAERGFASETVGSGLYIFSKPAALAAVES
jgi:hypothetical protein